jgi:uncharacterized membrane protein
MTAPGSGSTPTSASSAPSAPSASASNAGRGALVGLIPLGVVALLLAATLGLTALVRQMVLAQGFFAEERAVIPTLGIGLAVTVIAYIIACVRTLRQVRVWQSAGEDARAAGTLWALGLTALIVLAPLLLAIFLPQHPSHPAPQ